MNMNSGWNFLLFFSRSMPEFYGHAAGKYVEFKQWQLVSSLLHRVLTQSNNINKHDQWLHDSKRAYPIKKTTKKTKKNKTNPKQSPHNCFWIVYYSRVASSTQTSENVLGKIGRAQTCNEYISWLAETYLNIISNEQGYTLCVLLAEIA